MRQIILDTETTGLDPKDGHKIIEIGCVELVERRLTGKTFHTFLNPKREIEKGAYEVHGLSLDFLKDKPTFSAIWAALLAFVQDSEVIIHNAPFDVAFLNAELANMAWPQSFETYCDITDTLILARQQFPGQRNNLDALCKRFKVDNSKRIRHGALLDAEILAEVYLALTGGQKSFLETLMISHQASEEGGAQNFKIEPRKARKVILANEEELQRHEAFLSLLTGC